MIAYDEYDAGYENGIDSLTRDIYELQDENARLRELVAAMWGEIHADPYTIDQVAESFDRHEWIWCRVQELGIEVDA